MLKFVFYIKNGILKLFSVCASCSSWIRILDLDLRQLFFHCATAAAFSIFPVQIKLFCLFLYPSIRYFFLPLMDRFEPLNLGSCVSCSTNLLTRLIRLGQRKRISHKQSARWQHLSRLKARALFFLQK